ncbi:MAG: 6-carboxytetrahydropterin synthase QueD [Treponema sp.]|jgi:6-pyruvoyltetrahydropterin/6-carboxytetrahydropterin synthase|nr:6-carboxytetrahydropterin synthase QueD [Treponema sp.]
MYTVRVEADFAAAHFLSHYRGKCENLHGHNYRVRLWVRGKELDPGGMLVDFGALKEILRHITGELDHSNLNERLCFQNDPSAERIARYIFDKALSRFQAQGIDPALLQAVEVFETPGSMARFERDEGQKA